MFCHVLTFSDADRHVIVKSSRCTYHCVWRLEILQSLAYRTYMYFCQNTPSLCNCGLPSGPQCVELLVPGVPPTMLFVYLVFQACIYCFFPQVLSIDWITYIFYARWDIDVSCRPLLPLIVENGVSSCRCHKWWVCTTVNDRWQFMMLFVNNNNNVQLMILRVYWLLLLTNNKFRRSSSYIL